MPADVTVTGIFESGRYEYDANVLFVSLSLGQELYDMEDSVHTIAVKTTDPYTTASQVKDSLNTTLPQPAYAQTGSTRMKTASTPSASSAPSCFSSSCSSSSSPPSAS